MCASSATLAVLFPGQGAQYVGMGADLCEAFPEAAAVFARADEVLGWPLSALCFEGPEDELSETSNTQPAIYVASWALWCVLQGRLGGILPEIACVAGHSLGEFTALAAAGAFSFEEGLSLVRCRGEAMRDVGEEAPGGMAALVGLSDEVVAEIVATSRSEDCDLWIANYNSPGQLVVAGLGAPLERAMSLAAERGAKRVVRLAVSVACHTPLMVGAAARLGEALESTPLQRPWTPIISNAEAEPLQDSAEIEQALMRQLTHPVRWVESVQTMAKHGVTQVLEVGPRSVVAALTRRVDRSLRTHTVTDAASLEAFAAEMAG